MVPEVAPPTGVSEPRFEASRSQPFAELAPVVRLGAATP